MKYLLDTNICIYLIKKKDKKLLNKFMRHSPIDFAISSVTVSELWYGVHKSAKQNENKEALLQFLQPFEIIDFNEEAAKSYGLIRAALENNGKIIGSMDLLIAAVALANNLVLLTNNEKEFQRVPKLKIENWVK